MVRIKQDFEPIQTTHPEVQKTVYTIPTTHPGYKNHNLRCHHSILYLSIACFCIIQRTPTTISILYIHKLYWCCTPGYTRSI